MIPLLREADTGSPIIAGPPSRSIRLPLPLHRPLWTFTLLAVNILVWLSMTAMGGSQNPLVLVRFGAKYNPLIAAGQYWRLLTACFIHIGLMHLAFNGYALFSIGLESERRLGRGRFLLLYILSGLAGSVLSFVGSDALSAGASGAIFGLIGAAIAYFAIYRQQFGQLGKRQLTGMVIVAAYNLFWGLTTPGIDNLGHIGGLLAGLVLGWAYCPRYVVVRPTVGEEPYSVVVHPIVGGQPYSVVDRFRRTRAWSVSLGTAVVLVALTLLGAQVRG